MRKLLPLLFLLTSCSQEQTTTTSTVQSVPAVERRLDAELQWNCDSSCKWYQPDCYSYKGYCATFKNMGNVLVDKMAFAIARDSTITSAAKRDGWNKATCYGVATPPVGILLGIYSTPICAAVGAGVGTPICYTVIAGLAGAITTGVCTQLCHDHILVDEGCR